MIKASSKTALGEPLLFLGLSGENVTRLAAGERLRTSRVVCTQPSASMSMRWRTIAKSSLYGPRLNCVSTSRGP